MERQWQVFLIDDYFIFVCFSFCICCSFVVGDGVVVFLVMNNSICYFEISFHCIFNYFPFELADNRSNNILVLVFAQKSIVDERTYTDMNLLETAHVNRTCFCYNALFQFFFCFFLPNRNKWLPHNVICLSIPVLVFIFLLFFYFLPALALSSWSISVQLDIIFFTCFFFSISNFDFCNCRILLWPHSLPLCRCARVCASCMADLLNVR